MREARLEADDERKFVRPCACRRIGGYQGFRALWMTSVMNLHSQMPRSLGGIVTQSVQRFTRPPAPPDSMLLLDSKVRINCIGIR